MANKQQEDENEPAIDLDLIEKVNLIFELIEAPLKKAIAKVLYEQELDLPRQSPLKNYEGTSVPSKFLLDFIASHPTGSSTTFIAKSLGKKVSTIRKAMSRLRSKGLVYVDHNGWKKP